LLHVVLLIICHTFLYADESCKTVDLNSSPSSPFKKIPIYDQDGVGLCYSYAASQMVDYYRLKNSKASYDLTNPVYAAWLTSWKAPTLFKNIDLKGGGYVEDVVSALKKYGTCSDKETKKNLSELMKSTGKSEAEVLNFLQIMYTSAIDLKSAYTKKKLLNLIEKEAGINCSQVEESVSLLKLKKILGLYPSYILETFFKGCKKNNVDVPELKKFTIGSNEKFQNLITQSFERDLPPQVSINCGNSFFANPSIRTSSLIANTRFSINCGMHAVILTGRKKIQKNCSVLIRNSYGALWYPDGAIDCACKTMDGKYKAHCKRGEGQEYLGCWFKEIDVLSNTGDISVFE